MKAESDNTRFARPVLNRVCIYKVIIDFALDCWSVVFIPVGMLRDEDVLEERCVRSQNLQVLAPEGWVPVTHVVKTVPLPLWRIATVDYHLECADQHLVETVMYGFIPADRLLAGMLIVTKNGPQEVILSESCNTMESLYDIRVDSASHRYYAEGISSHNSTGIGGSELMKLDILPAYKSLYIAPMSDHVKTFAANLDRLQMGSVRPPELVLRQGLKNNQGRRTSATGGELKLLHVLSDVTRVRGNTAQTVAIDECLVGSTLVATPDGGAEVDSLRAGDQVLSFDTEGRITSCSVVRVVSKGLRIVWSVTTRSGRHMICTSNERISTPTGWKYLAEFMSDSDIKLCSRASYIMADRSRSSDRRVHVLGRSTSASIASDFLVSIAPDFLVSICYAGVQPVFDVEVAEHHTLFAGGIAVHNCQDMDYDHLVEIEQVQKAYDDVKCTIFSGTAKEKGTCLDQVFQASSMGIWHVKCSCKAGWHSLYDTEAIPKMISVDGLCCPTTGKLINPQFGEFVHAFPGQLRLNNVGFHLPQLIVPEYASGDAFLNIWRQFKKAERSNNINKFFMEIMGIAVDIGMSEITEDDLKSCCDDYTFASIWNDIKSGRRKYNYIVSGCDWGGTEFSRIDRTKVSYTVHSIYGIEGDGRMRLLHAYRYEGQHYTSVARSIADNLKRFQVFAVGADEGGGKYYNAYLRDQSGISSKRVITFAYSDTQQVMSKLDDPIATIMSLNRTDSISALYEDIKHRRLIFPTWQEASPFVNDFLHMRRNMTTSSQTGRTVMRYLRKSQLADDFLHSTNYAAMVKRVICRESLIPNQQLLRELLEQLGLHVQTGSTGYVHGYSGGIVAG